MSTAEKFPTGGPAVLRLLGRVIRTGPKHYGFIATDDGRQYFFHRREVLIRRMPRDNSIVTFQPVAQTAKGRKPRAIKIEILTEPEK